ncbi:hypothetical protein BGZ73_002669 [Actinomortierella ambigua]|nr:hypothetical protein BGZ73_002669 [Actinomortierella ambigua]
MPILSFNLLNCTVGSGVLALAFAMKESGFGLGIILSVTVAVFTWLALNMLIVTGKRIHVYHYAHLCEVTMGRFGFYLLNIMIFLLTAGACITYMVVIGDTIPVVLSLFGITPERRTVILPLLFFRSIGSLARVSIVSVMLLPPVLLVVAIRGLHYAPEHDHQLTFVGSNVFPAIGVMAFALMSTQTAFMNFMTLKRPTRARWATATGTAVFASWLISFVFALIGYLCFGNDVQPNIFNSFPSQDTWINVGRGLLGFSMFLTYPQAFYPARAAAHKVLGHEGDASSARWPTDAEHVLTTVALFVASLLGGLYLTDLGIAYQLIGGLCATSLAYIIPGTCYFLVFWSSEERLQRERATREYLMFKEQKRRRQRSSFAGAGGDEDDDDDDDNGDMQAGHAMIYEYDQSDTEESATLGGDDDDDDDDDDEEEGRKWTAAAPIHDSDSKTPLFQHSTKSYGAVLPSSSSESSLHSYHAAASLSSSSLTKNSAGGGETRYSQVRYRKTVWWHDAGAACLVVFGIFVMILSTTITVGKMIRGDE